MQRLFYGTMDLLLPIRCVVCGSIVPTGPDTVPFCGIDRHRLPVLDGPVCRQCSRPLEGFGGPGDLCGPCRDSEHDLEFVVAGYRYEPPLRRILTDWKFGGHGSWSPWLADRLVEQIGDRLDFGRWDSLVPVPLHRDRREQRGFNQARQLAEGLAGTVNVPVRTPVEKPVRTRPQSELGRRERLENLAGSFRLRGGGLPGERSCLIVDDVYTTGSTLRTVGTTLLEAGARRVAGLVLARSTGRGPSSGTLPPG